MDFLLISQKLENQPKMAEKSQNEKTAALPVTVATHRKTKRNSYLELGPISKKCFFWPKSAQKMPFWSPEGSVWQHIANPTPEYENSEFSTIIKWC